MNPYVQTTPTSILGEGPHWNAAKQELYYVDITDFAAHRYVPSTGEHYKVRVPDGRVSLVIPVGGRDNQYVIGLERTLTLMEWDGKTSTPTSLTTMFTVEPEESQNRFNDGKCDSSGRLWAGTMDTSGTSKSGNLYRVMDGNMHTVQTGIGTSNGIAWNRDNTLMFYIDTTERRVDVFDFDNEKAEISNRRPVYDYVSEGEVGVPDGMNIDANGNLWIACMRGGGKVIQVDPSTGRKMQGIALPAKNITSIAFGGPNLEVMYVTSATEGLTESEKLEQPTAGALFQITNTGARGMSGGYSFKL